MSYVARRDVMDKTEDSPWASVFAVSVKSDVSCGKDDSFSLLSSVF